MKKGQITVFIIIGILLLILLFLGIYLATGPDVEMDKLDASRIKLFMDACVASQAHEGLLKLGGQGGYLDVPGVIQKDETSYWFLDQINIQPTLGQIEKRLETYLNAVIKECDLKQFEKEGFSIETGTPKTEVFFSMDSTAITVDYPLEIIKQNARATYDTFSVELNVRLRKIYELASQIINLQLNPEFRTEDPLANLKTFNFTVDASPHKPGSILYTITDNVQFEQGRPFIFRFASRFKRSSLKRTVKLQENSHVVPTALPLIVYSVDRLAQLMVMPDTTINLHGEAVDSITVQQHYFDEAVRTEVPFHEHGDDSVTYSDLTWNLTYPIYEFNPTGLRFNKPQRLVIYWNEEKKPRKGNMGILYNDGPGGWRPLPAKANYEENYIYTDIPGFSNYTAIDCQEQIEKDVSAEAEVDPGAKCWVTLIIIVVIIILIIAAIILTFGAAAPVAATAGTAVTSGSTITAGTGAASVTTTAAGTVTATGGTLTVTTATTSATSTIAAGSSATVAAGSTVNIAAGASATFAGGAAGTFGSGVGATIAAGGLTAGLLTAGGAATVGTSSFFGTLGAAAVSVFTLSGLTALGFGIAILGGLVGGAYINSALLYKADKDTITFTPSCDQTIWIDKELKKSKGKCVPSEEEVEVTGGEPMSIQAQIKKCTGIRKYFCGKCSLKCSSLYL